MKTTLKTATLLLSCPDQRGIVAEISHFIHAYNGSIVHSDQHNDPETKTFFMRIEWDLADFTIPDEKLYSAFEPIANRFKMNWELKFSGKRKKMALFTSKFDHCLYDLLVGVKSGEIDVEIPLIISNHQTAKPIAEHFDIPFYHVPVTKDNKKEAEAKQIKLLKDAKIDFAVLARYMQILSPKFVETYKHRVINIHHSFLPAFIGAKPYHQAYARGVKIIGATSHYVTSDLDQGPIIEQDVAAISHRDRVEDLVNKGKNLEKVVLTRAVKLHVQDKILIFNNKTVIFD